LQAAGLLETVSDKDAMLTVFAPTNDAFDRFLATLGEEESAAFLADPKAVGDVRIPRHLSPVHLQSL
jgi:hypothetical protein